MSNVHIYDCQSVLLTQREFEILLLLVQNKGRIISQELLFTKVWGYDFDGNEGVVHVHMRNLRNKLPADIITTVKSVGYRLEELQNEA